MPLAPWLDRLSSIAPTFVDAAVRGAVVLLAALVLTHFMRRRSAAARHLVWVGAVVIQLLLPVFAIWGPKWNVAVPEAAAIVSPIVIPVKRDAPEVQPEPAAANTVVTRDEVASSPPATTAAVTTTTTPSPVAPRPSPVITGRQILLALWVLGALVILVRLAAGTAIVARLARRGNRVDDGNWLSLAQKLSTNLQIDRPLTLLRGTKLGVPVTWGIVYPVVLLPDDADEWTEERRRFVLVHEMAHVKRLDALTQLAGQLALALFWFDPLVWIANRRMQMEREHACDDYVIRQGTTPSTYAEELLTMVRALGTSDRSTQPAFAALAMARRTEFEGRMLSILDPVLDRHPLGKARTFASVLAALLLVVPLAALHPYRRAAVTTPTAAVVHDSAATAADSTSGKAKKDAGSLFADMPSSFKLSITPASPKAPPAMPKPVTPLSALAAGTAALQKSTTSLATNLAKVSGRTPGCASIQIPSNVNGISSHISGSDENDGSVVIDYTSYSRERCTSATLIGHIKYTPDEDDVSEMAFGSHAAFAERTATMERELVLSPALAENEPRTVVDGALAPGSGRKIAYAYRVNGRSAAYDDDARRWMAGLLPKVLRESGVNVKGRVARWKERDGLDAALSRIASFTSSSAKRTHYLALLDAGKLASDEVDKLVRSASTSMAGSSSDLRAIIVRAAPNVRLSRQSMSSVESALTSMSSSGDKSAVLRVVGQTDDRDMLLSVMRVAGTIASSGDRSGLLQRLVPRYLTKSDRALEKAFFDVAAGIPSSGDLRSTLMAALREGAKTPVIARHIIETARLIASSGDRSAVLISLVTDGALTTKELRDAFFSAAAEIPSDGDRVRVLQAAIPLMKQ